nr:MAG: hypothetical protein 1 [Guangxi cysto-like virus 3]
MIYLYPLQFLESKAGEVLARAGVITDEVTLLVEFIRAVDAGAKHIGVSPEVLELLGRFPRHLTPEELPSPVLNVPGVITSPDWMRIATMFPVVDWMTIEKQLEKSGHTAHTVDALDKKDEGAYAPTLRHVPDTDGRTSIDEDDDHDAGF